MSKDIKGLFQNVNKRDFYIPKEEKKGGLAFRNLTLVKLHGHYYLLNSEVKVNIKRFKII